MLIEEITADYKKADPGHDSYFDQQRAAFEAKGLAEYHGLISQIKARYGGTPAPPPHTLSQPLPPPPPLHLITPQPSLHPISHPTQPTPPDKATTDKQIADKQIEVWVYN